MTYVVTLLPTSGPAAVGMFSLGVIATLIGVVALYFAAKH